MTKTIGFIGLGLMGCPMASRLLSAGYSLTVWNRTVEKGEVLVGKGAVFADSPKALAEKSEVILMCLTDEAAVNCVLFGESGVLSAKKNGQIIVDHSTLMPQSVLSMLDKTSVKQMNYIDAPVTGSVPGAENGTLVVFAGGDSAVFDKVKPILSHYAARINYMGKHGAGQATKMCNQTVLINSILAICEMLALAEKQGLNLQQVINALSGGLIDSKIFQILSRAIIGKEKKLAHIKDVVKDLRYVIETAGRVGGAVPLTEQTEKLVTSLMKAGLGSEDIVELMQIYR